MENFDKLIQSSKPVLVDFYAEWCGPCKIMKPRLLDVAERIGDQAKIVEVDIDIEKLCYYTSQENEYKYSFGFAIWLYKKNCATIKVFQKGKEMGDLCYKWSLKR